MTTGNTLLDLMPAETLEGIAPYSQHVIIESYEIVHYSNEELGFLYAPLSCTLSVTLLAFTAVCLVTFRQKPAATDLWSKYSSFANP